MDELSYSGTSARPKKKLPKRLIIFIIFFAVILALIGGLVFFVTRDSSEPAETEQTITLPEENQEEPAITEEATPTPEEEEEEVTPSKAATTPTKAPTGAASSTSNSSVKVAIQNGSGESGVAGAASEVIKEAGFTVSSTGNADNFDYEDVTINIKASKKSFLADLEEALSVDYTVGDTSTDLAETSTYDALVIIGK